MSSTERCVLILINSIFMNQVQCVQRLSFETSFKSGMLLNQAPDSDEELEIDDETKIILIDKQVNFSLLFVSPLFTFPFFQDIGDDSNDTDYTPGGPVAADDYPAKRVISLVNFQTIHWPGRR